MADTEDMAPNRANGTATPRAPRRRTAAAAASPRNTARRVRAATAADADSLEDQVAQLQADLKSITSTLGRMGSTAGSELRSSANAQAEKFATRGQAALDSAQDEFGAIEKQIKDTIREKPLTAVAGAVALGFILAVITR